MPYPNGRRSGMRTVARLAARSAMVATPLSTITWAATPDAPSHAAARPPSTTTRVARPERSEGAGEHDNPDLTHPSSIPKELEAIVPSLAVPVQPLLEGSRPYAMFKDYWKYDWVLPVYRYEGLEPLLAVLAEKVIAPAEGKVEGLQDQPARDRVRGPRTRWRPRWCVFPAGGCPEGPARGRTRLRASCRYPSCYPSRVSHRTPRWFR